MTNKDSEIVARFTAAVPWLTFQTNPAPTMWATIDGRLAMRLRVRETWTPTSTARRVVFSVTGPRIDWEYECDVDDDPAKVAPWLAERLAGRAARYLKLWREPKARLPGSPNTYDTRAMRQHVETLLRLVSP